MDEAEWSIVTSTSDLLQFNDCLATLALNECFVLLKFTKETDLKLVRITETKLF